MASTTVRLLATPLRLFFRATTLGWDRLGYFATSMYTDVVASRLVRR